jgi:hypothetical protein
VTRFRIELRPAAVRALRKTDPPMQAAFTVPLRSSVRTLDPRQREHSMLVPAYE